MSTNLLKVLNGDNDGIFKKYIENMQGKNISIAWYPSGYRDFRALLFLSKPYLNNNVSELTIESPQLFIYSDYAPWNNAHIEFNKDILFQDRHTTFSVLEREWLPNLTIDNNSEYMKNIVDFKSNPLLENKVLFMNIKVTSTTLGSYNVPLLYIFTCNELFFHSYLKPTRAIIKYIIHVRYGGGLMGGGKANGKWLLHVLWYLQTKVFITDNHLDEKKGDSYFLTTLSKGRFLETNQRIKLSKFHQSPSALWSNHGDVTWNFVSNINPDSFKKERYSNLETDNGDQNTEANELVFRAFIMAFEGALFQDTSKVAQIKESNEQKAIIDGLNQILQGKGFSSENPIMNLKVSHFYKLMSSLGYRSSSRKSEYEFKDPIKRGVLDKITFIDEEGGGIIMYNFIHFQEINKTLQQSIISI